MLVEEIGKEEILNRLSICAAELSARASSMALAYRDEYRDAYARAGTDLMKEELAESAANVYFFLNEIAVGDIISEDDVISKGKIIRKKTYDFIKTRRELMENSDDIAKNLNGLKDAINDMMDKLCHEASEEDDK